MIRRETPRAVLSALDAGEGENAAGQPQRVFTVDLDADSYDLLARAVRTRIERGLYMPITERTWHVLRDASQQGLPWRLSMEREEAESLCDWFEKTFDVVSALADRWPDANNVLDAALRGTRAIRAAIP